MKGLVPCPANCPAQEQYLKFLEQMHHLRVRIVNFNRNHVLSYRKPALTSMKTVLSPENNTQSKHLKLVLGSKRQVSGMWERFPNSCHMSQLQQCELPLSWLHHDHF